MAEITIIPDSSFYICFLDDIKKPDYILKIVEYSGFKFFTGMIIKREIEKSSFYCKIEKTINSKVQIFKYYNYGEILKPFFSLEEINEGEHEVIVISYILFLRNSKFIAIIDDANSRKFIHNNFPEIFKFIEWTISFLSNCYILYSIFPKKEIISILEMIQNSKFRVKKEVVEETIEQIRCS